MFGWSIERIIGRIQTDRGVQDADWRAESATLRMVYGKALPDRLEIYEMNRAMCKSANRDASQNR